MLKNIEIYWQDLTPFKQQEILQTFGESYNPDSSPIATISFEDLDGCDDYLSLCEEAIDLFEAGNPIEAIAEMLHISEEDVIQIIERGAYSG